MIQSYLRTYCNGTARRLSTVTVSPSQQREIPLNSRLTTLTHARIDSKVHCSDVKGVTLVAQGPRLPIVSLALCIPAGSLFERSNGSDNAGVSQLYRHALLKVRIFK
jgi:hypothetical protein